MVKVRNGFQVMECHLNLKQLLKKLSVSTSKQLLRIAEKLFSSKVLMHPELFRMISTMLFTSTPAGRFIKSISAEERNQLCEWYTRSSEQ